MTILKIPIRIPFSQTKNAAIVTWVAAFLTGRTRNVMMSGRFQMSIPVPSLTPGVPNQDSHFPSQETGFPNEESNFPSHDPSDRNHDRPNPNDDHGVRNHDSPQFPSRYRLPPPSRRPSWNNPTTKYYAHSARTDILVAYHAPARVKPHPHALSPYFSNRYVPHKGVDQNQRFCP